MPIIAFACIQPIPFLYFLSCTFSPKFRIYLSFSFLELIIPKVNSVKEVDTCYQVAPPARQFRCRRHGHPSPFLVHRRNPSHRQAQSLLVGLASHPRVPPSSSRKTRPIAWRLVPFRVHEVLTSQVASVQSPFAYVR